ncbi:DUF1203 domain-containing protein [Hoeflea olei]|uniref:DUF1203 domain-containing protein n=1 Tax=Hoeflea olei TaxID=1480615 RepID=A0A1C1YZN6_9HYPH|nr:DUF1203 domain-containing protein [Hoeflea olei]OCW58889.1 hypothetical protein AWJ14_21190 [Hoeflea olei]
MTIRFIPMDEATAAHLRNGGPDAYGNAPEKRISDGAGVRCRRCMDFVARGEPYLVAAWRPFTALHAYAETGPVFLHADPCSPAPLSGALPAFLESPAYVLRGYDAGERIVYGTGDVVERGSILARAEELLAMPEIEAVHVRSARNTCYHCKAVREA